MDADLFDEWFRIADRDRDGKVSGAEAVDFFQKSGLSKETLFEVWKMVAGNNSALTKPQFFGTLRLIALAQRSGGRLNPKEAQSTLIGVGPSLPPPEMAGLEHTRRPQVAQLVDSAPPAGAGAAPGGAQRAPSAAADSGSYLPMSQETLAGVQAEFAALDGDRDGYVQGKECFELFIKSGLPKDGLWAIWNVVAGTAGQLNQQQFLQARYLMDNAKKGIPPPAKLPTGTFPPIAYGAGQTPSGYTDSNSSFAPDYTSQQIPMPELPGRQRYQEPSRKGYEPQGPSLDEGLMQTLPASERNRLQTERSAIVTTEQQLQKMRQEQDSAKQKAQFYEGALRELLLFRSKTSTALLQLQERFDKEVAEANSLEAQYEHDYSSVQSNYTEGRNMMLEFSRAKARKLETQTKLAELRKDIEQMGKITPEEVAMEDKQTVQLQQEVAAAEVKRSALEVRVRAVIEERAKMERELETLRTALAEGQTGMTAAQADLKALQATMAENPKQGAEELQKMLKSATVMWKQLFRAATLARVPIPPEAAMTPPRAIATSNGNAPDATTPGPGALIWDEFAAANAADWDNFKDEGFVIVNALPDENQMAGPDSDGMFADDANSGESSTFHAERGHDLDTAASAMSNGSLDLDLMQSKGTVSNRLGPDRLVNWEAF